MSDLAMRRQAQKHFKTVMPVPDPMPATFAALHRVVHDSMDLAEAFAQKRSQLAAGGRLTAHAIREDLQGHLRDNVSDVLRGYTGAIDAARAEVAARRAAFGHREVDKSDVAAAMLRQELRSYLRGLPEGERAKVAFSGDPAIVEAILSAPAALSGLNADMHEKLVQVIAEKTNPAELAAIEQLETAITAAQSALTMTEQALDSTVGPELVAAA